MKPRHATLKLMTIVVVGLAGCEGSFLKPMRGGQSKPVSSPPPSEPGEQTIRPRYAATHEPTVDTAAEKPDPAIAKLDTRIKQYAGRVPVSDLDRKVNPAPAPTRTAQPPAPARRAPAPAQPTAATAKLPAPTSPDRGSAPPNQPVYAQPTPARAKAPMADIAASPQPQRVPPVPVTPATNELRVELIDVRPATGTAPKPRDDDAMSPANQPIRQATKKAPADTPSLIQQLEETVRQNPQQLDDQFKRRLLYLATGQMDKATGAFKDVDPVQGEMLSALFKTLTSAHEALREPTAAAPAALTAVDELQRLLSQQSPIIISKVELITSVNSFGDYEAISPARFPAGRGVHAFCYIEIANFHCEPTPDGRLRTVLSAKLEVFDASGKVIWQRSVPNIEDRSRTPRRDFFVPLEINLPASLPASDYVLKVTIEDKLGATTDQQRKTFTIGQ